MKENQKSRYDIELLLLFLAAMLPRLILIFTVADPVRTPMDELSTMSAGAYMAGLDWTKATEFGNHYYGGGMTILMAPLFKLIKDPVTLYRACLVFCAVLQSLVAPVACQIMRKYLNIRDRGFRCLASLAAAFLMVNRAMLVYNEHMLVLVSWLVALVLCRLVMESRKEEQNYRIRAIYSMVLMVLLSYSLTLHTRAKTLWIALVLLVILYFLLYKKWLVAKLPALLSGVAGYWLAGRFIYWSKTTLWLWHEGVELKNTAVKLNLSKELLLSPTSWQGWFSTVLGQVHTSVIFTGGFAAIAITLLVIYICTNGKDIFVKKKRPVTENQEQLQVRPYLLVCGTFFMMCIGATILAQSITWLFRVQEALTETPYESGAYGYKAFTYFRYYGAYMGPFFLAGMGYLFHYRTYLKKYLPAVFAVFAGMQLLFLCVVLPHISKNMVASEVYWPFGLHRSFDDPMRCRVYLAGVLVSGISFLVMFFCLCKGKRTVLMAVLLGLLVYQYVYNGIYYDGSNIARYNEKASAGYELISGMEKAGYELPEEIYVTGYRAGQSQKPLYTYQFLLNRHRMIPGEPEASVEEAVVFCSKQDYKKLLKEGYQFAVLDVDECVYVKGERYVDMMKEYGVEFTESIRYGSLRDQ
ncbi:MAG: hypothetical protein SPD93_00660 [Lachnospiraceae bacterium]|nr:hypothetical protein [Lachnospiraceae bacterium]